MKFILLTVALTMIAGPAFADSSIHCKFSKAQSTEIKKIAIFGGNPGTVGIFYRNGVVESLEPVEAIGGLFDQFKFAPSIGAARNGYLFVPGSQLGDIHIKYACHLTPSIAWERCQSQGNPNDVGQYSAVKININGQVFHFSHKRICQRFKN